MCYKMKKDLNVLKRLLRMEVMNDVFKEMKR